MTSCRFPTSPHIFPRIIHRYTCRSSNQTIQLISSSPSKAEVLNLWKVTTNNSTTTGQTVGWTTSIEIANTLRHAESNGSCKWKLFLAKLGVDKKLLPMQVLGEATSWGGWRHLADRTQAIGTTAGVYKEYMDLTCTLSVPLMLKSGWTGNSQ
ncbi:unnamed protein product [Periconia digitata]|uniref:Uncharacterized protein n=1 Tax=Periconia digitata TaxID=1303443 RepID=A0A9W4US83_9PLEO|nr:unnamed protein product [Periconia digitata]